MIRNFVALVAACALACAPAVATAQTFPQFLGPGGARYNPGMSIIAGIDTATGAPCLISETPTCRLPNPGAANLAPRRAPRASPSP